MSLDDISWNNLSALLSHQATTFGERDFVLFDQQPKIDQSNSDQIPELRKSLSFDQLDQQVNQACRLLESSGIRRGDVFNLHLPNSLSFLILWFAGVRMGAVMMPTNVQSSQAEMEYLLGHSDARIAFTTSSCIKTLTACCDALPGLKQVIECDPFATEPEAHSFETLLTGFDTAPYHCPCRSSDLAAIMYTSGTTSKPKGVMVTHANYLKAGSTVANALGLTASDRQFVVLPLFHGNAQYYSTMSALLSGASIALMDRFSASQYFDKCIEYKCTVASLFAAPMRMILAQPEQQKHRQNKLRSVIYAQNITLEQEQDWYRRFGAPLSQLWGMTETMGPPLMNPVGVGQRNWTVGKPVGGYDVRLVDNDGHPLGVDKEGEIAVRGIPGKSIMLGYFNNPQATRQTIRNGWLHTGDNAVVDEDGFFRFVDRKKDMIKRSGENVSAGEVESVLQQHPKIFECAVVGIPEKMRDEEIVAVVVLYADQLISEREIIAFCEDKLAAFRVPQRVVFRTTLPKTSVGKIQKHKLKDELQ